MINNNVYLLSREDLLEFCSQCWIEPFRKLNSELYNKLALLKRISISRHSLAIHAFDVPILYHFS